ncbi:primosomal protein N' [Mechercharimyces sp. CAU 1602]|uniref:primosomal protein N' n=1 Tax=Mechercharimyces sp. CAU 1602 TaxID=2973933 RepID=UPI002162D72C|nr:primosomal protein N' [Mechercharimyces sp. CAU 1602]MCS1351398.1 primosomal protein N' [Mechercharimyces sp. CAU 1602]
MREEERIASVIVDVPTNQTDRPFDYIIPEELKMDVQVGSRVHVPFGRRQLLGYVVSISHHSEVKKLKAIAHVMDVTPPLTPELVRLAHWMAEKYLCPTIMALHAMVPAVLKGKYERVVRLPLSSGVSLKEPQAYPAAARPLLQLLLKKEVIKQDEALKQGGVTEKQLRQWVRAGWFILSDEVSDRITKKKVTWLKPALDRTNLATAIEELPVQAARQREILQFFYEHPAEIPLTSLLTTLELNRSSIKSLVDKGWLVTEEREEKRDPYEGRSFAPSTPLALTAEQQSAFEAIITPLKEYRTHSILLQGVTGSGKTEIYLQAIEQCLQQGREAIVLVPEISLTPQMVSRFKSRFGARVAVLHSGLSNGERYDEWRKIRAGEVEVAIGARSAIFAPFEKIGLVIIDEEHESSYQQEENPRYHAREAALTRAAEHQAVVVLGTATPAVATYFDARVGKYEWVQLHERVHGRPFPPVHIADMREELRQGNRSMFSRTLSEKLTRCVERGEQAVFFLNRRGYSTFVMCRDCGKVVECPNCDISLTYHHTNQSLRCHYCGHEAPVPSSCPDCASEHIRYFGTGTQRVEAELAKRFPGLRVIRMDVDTTSRKGAHERLLTRFGNGEADVLLGTQMIAKGLDFPRVTLVGVIAADTMLRLPHYQAAERTYQLLTQVSGRAGRHEAPGEVVVQTYTPDHYSIELASQYEVESFYREECLTRKTHRYPPFCGLFTLLFSHPDQLVVLKHAQQTVQTFGNKLPEQTQVLGPVPAPIPRIKDRYRMNVMIKCAREEQAQAQVRQLLRSLRPQWEDPQLRVSIEYQQ